MEEYWISCLDVTIGFSLEKVVDAKAYHLFSLKLLSMYLWRFPHV